ncbi:hypothetical protein [Mycobacterium servetii]|uniref:Uncharacterized protein n=1 Tax=Mycobacterium servetii TaxID=3237418 RepID=A0ABV4C126_9MYCO
MEPKAAWRGRQRPFSEPLRPDCPLGWPTAISVLLLGLLTMPWGLLIWMLGDSHSFR